MKAQIFYPEKSYPDLYQDVMRFQLFPDSKTFADAVTRIPIDKLNQKYQLINRYDRDQIDAFVKRWFEIPTIETSVYLESQYSTRDHINRLWDALLRNPDHPQMPSSLIPLPYSYIVPGGRFREIYYWDSYFTMLGLKISGKKSVIHDMVRNFAWLITQFGHIPNGNRSYFLSRSQPPFFSMMVSLLAEIEGDSVYTLYLPAMLEEYSFWMNEVDHNSNGSGRVIRADHENYLNRYYDDSNSPRAESWAEDMKLYNAHPEESENLFRNLKAACESGWDFSSRWLTDKNNLASIHTTAVIPVDLNSLLFMLEKTITKAYVINEEINKSLAFEKLAEQRAEKIHKYLWDDDTGIFNDKKISPIEEFGTPTLAMMCPLYAGIATHDQAQRSIDYLEKNFLKPGGWVTSVEYTGQQWDAPNGWPPLQWITYVGLKNYGSDDLAKEGAHRWLALNDKVFRQTGRMMEKYNVEDLSLSAGGGEYPVQDGFGWTNGVYLALSEELGI